MDATSPCLSTMSIADIDRTEDVRDLPADAAMKAFPKLLK